MEILNYHVSDGQSGIRIDRYLSEKNEELSRSYIQKLLKEQKIKVNNAPVKANYKVQIQEWFDKKVRANTEQLTFFWKSVEEGNVSSIEQYLNRTLSNSISVFDTKAPEKEKESSYHTFLIVLLI